MNYCMTVDDMILCKIYRLALYVILSITIITMIISTPYSS